MKDPFRIFIDPHFLTFSSKKEKKLTYFILTMTLETFKKNKPIHFILKLFLEKNIVPAPIHVSRASGKINKLSKQRHVTSHSSFTHAIRDKPP